MSKHGFFSNAIFFIGEEVTEFQYSVIIPSAKKDADAVDEQLKKLKSYLRPEELETIRSRATKNIEQYVYCIRNGITAQGFITIDSKGIILDKVYRLNRVKTIKLIDSTAEKLISKHLWDIKKQKHQVNKLKKAS